jgi:hypothetical protein
MSIEIYPPGYGTRYQLTHAISIQMTDFYNDIGKLQLVVPVDDYNIAALQEGSMLFDTVRGTSYIIVNPKHDTVQNRITANGYTSNWLLNKRAVAVPQYVDTVEPNIYAMIRYNLRGLTRIGTAKSTGLTEKYQPEEDETNLVYGGQLLDKIIDVLDSVSLGHKMMWDGNTLQYTFKVYKGVDRTDGIHAVVFSEEQGTCTDLVISKDVSTYKNVAYVAYKLQTEDTIPEVAEIGTATGDDRYERWFDSSIAPENGESAAETKKKAVSFGNLELGKYIKRSSFNVTIDPSELGVRYDLGDIVTCVSVRFGVKFNARITGVKYKLDRTGERTEIVLGDPILTALGEAKLNG